MSDRKVSYITLKEKKEDGTVDPKAVERNMIMEGKRDGDELMRRIMDGSQTLGEDPWSRALGIDPKQMANLFDEIAKDFDENGIIDPKITTPQHSETSYVFTKPPKKESLIKRVFSWMKRKITNT